MAGSPAGARADSDDGGRFGGGDRGPGTQGDSEGEYLTAEIGIQVEIDGEPVPGADGDLTSADPDWEPPACWYEPAYTPQELKALVDALRGLPIVGGLVGTVFDLVYDNPDGEDPGDERAVNPRIMAEYAYDRIPIPHTDIEINPEGVQKVNLPTWIWLDQATFQPVSAVATLPGTPYQVTTTATPAALRIEPGTEDAETHMPGGVCEVRADGSIGEPYTPGAEDPPPCGVTYLRSTTADGEPFELSATLVWEVSWTDNVSGQTQTLPDGVFEDTVEISVEEIQTIVR
ncbi:hypothetical protein [Streptomyces sp. YIM 98790]|uniref:hypothetical protein n=1 Tax=Streptomyces sp. YIM 98790 TaxID=2689077 RepID=UPI001FB67FF8|nr:hypothetical protein [Streptomyces sp. YIM 98790]